MTSCVVPGCKTQKLGAKVSLHLFPDPSREPERHMKWVRVICAEKLLTKDPVHVFKQLRVCRSHFDDKSFNGICKKLLNTAVPSLHLYKNPVKNSQSKTKLMLYENKLKNILKKNTDIQAESFQLVTESYEVPTLKLSEEELMAHDKLWLSDVEVEEIAEEESVEETYELMEVENTHDGEQFKLVMKNESKKELEPEVKRKTEEPKTNSNAKHNLLAPLSSRSFRNLRADFYKCPKRQLAQTICE